MADLILYNANIILSDQKNRRESLVAIKDGRIEAVTNNDVVREFKRSNTKVINCKGKTLVPGFIDAHCHLLGYAESLVTMSLSPESGVHSIADIQAKIKMSSERTPPGEWIRGKGYNEFYLEEKRHPTRKDIDDVSPHHPVKLTHRTGHAHVLNSIALQTIGISINTPEPVGSIIERDIYTGEPNGLLFEMGDFLSKRIPLLQTSEKERGVLIANEKLISVGITSLQDGSIHNDFNQWEQLCYFKTKGILSPRISMAIGVKNYFDCREKNFDCPLSEHQLRLNGVKIILDEISGSLSPSQKELNEIVLKIHQDGLQVAIHAIEENAIEAACSAIEKALEKRPKEDHRHAIVHGSVCTPSLAKRLSLSNIFVITQPSFIYYNGERYLQTVPESQKKYLYPNKTLLTHGVTVAGSSDFPVVPPNPVIGIYAAVTRRSASNESVVEEEKISVMDAIKMHTVHAAQATFEEKNRGSLTPGKFADIVVLNRDPLAAPPDEIKDIEVEMTIIGGKIVYRKN